MTTKTKLPRFFRSRSDGTRHYWDPSSEVRDLDRERWKTETLSSDLETAIRQAEKLNAELDAWRQSGGAACATGGAEAKPAAQAKPAAGTLAAVIGDYRQDERFTKLAAKTRYEYSRNHDVLRDWQGDQPIALITRKEIKSFYRELRRKAPAEANAILRALRVVLKYALDEEIIEATPMYEFELIEPERQTKLKLWTDEAIAAFVAKADELGCWSLGTAVLLNAWLGQREGDIIRLSRGAYRDGSIWIRQSKTEAEVDLPVDEVPDVARRLREELARTSAVTVLVSERTGRPYKGDHFRKLFAEIRDQVPECEGLWFMWLRHTAVTRLAEAGCTNSEIAAITGHTDQSVDRIIKRYRVRTKKMAISAFRRRLAAAAQA